MDNAFLYSKRTEQLGGVTGAWIANVPFDQIPEGFIRQMKPRSFTYEEFIEIAPLLDSLPTYWNLVFVNELMKIQLVLWGSLKPLEKMIEVERISIHPILFKVGGEVMLQILDKLRGFAKAMDYKRVYWTTKKWRAFLRKLPGDVYTNDTMAVEVY
jgi:hypothetical protein